MKIEKNNNEIPDYLNGEFFKSTLEQGLNEKNIEIKKINFTMGSAPGDNYTSQIYRAEVTYSALNTPETTKSLIIKSMPDRNDLGEIVDIHGKEASIYQQFLPKMEKYLDGEKFSAKCYLSTREPLNTIVFDDLKPHGYRLADREKGLNEAHCRVVLKKLGKFHAISMILAAQDPTEFEKLQTGFFTSASMDTKIFDSFFIGSLKGEIKVAQKWPGFENIVEKMKKFCDTFKSKLLEVTKPTEDEIKVLNHGDLWTNNFLFKYENESSDEPLDVAFVDYQGSYYTSPGIDLNYFLNTSAQLDVLKTKRDFIIEEYYYKTFKSILEKYGYKNIPTLGDIKHEIFRKEVYGLTSATGILPITSMERANSTDNSIETLSDDNIAATKIDLACSTKRLQDTLRYLLVRADNLGILD